MTLVTTTRSGYYGPSGGSGPSAPERKKAPGSLGPGGLWKKRFAPRCFPVLLNTVSSPRGALTAVFGMGTGVTPPPEARTKGAARDRYSPPGILHEIVLPPHSQARHGRFSPPPASAYADSGGGRRPGLSADQKRYGQRLAALAHPPCRTGGLPVAFGGLAARDGSSPGGLGA